MKILKYLGIKTWKEFLLINIGVLLMACSYTVFLDSNDLVIGGVGGIATILRNVFEGTTILGMQLSSSLFILILNIILLVVSLFAISKEFFLKTLYASLIYPVFTFLWAILYEKLIINIMPNILTIQSQFENEAIGQISTMGAYLLIIVFGAVIAGFGLGLALKQGSSTGGVDIIQQIFLKYFKMPFSVSLIIVDGTILVSSGIYFQDFYLILYGIIYILISGYLIDSIVFSGFNSRAISIVSDHAADIKQQIFKTLARGVTVINAYGGYTNNEKKMLICIMSNSEFYKMRDIIYQIDPKAFIYVTKASEVHGEGFSYESEE